MNNLAIIPARGGSKRIPRKNVKEFLGKPIIAYAIEAAFESGLFQEVMVSTDDSEIADIAIAYGAKIPFIRSPENADDYATTADVLTEVLHRYEEANQQFAHACCIYPCAPLIQQDSLKRAYLILQKGFASVFPIVPYGYPIQRALRTDGERVYWNDPKNSLARSQDLEALYHDSGQFYWIRVSNFLEKGNLISENSGHLVLNEMEVQDIDTEVDWKLAEFKYKLMHGLANQI